MWECSMEIVSTVCVYVGMQYGDCECVCMWECAYVRMQYGDCEYVCMWECSMEIVSMCVCEKD